MSLHFKSRLCLSLRSFGYGLIESIRLMVFLFPLFVCISWYDNYYIFIHWTVYYTLDLVLHFLHWNCYAFFFISLRRYWFDMAFFVCDFEFFLFFLFFYVNHLTLLIATLYSSSLFVSADFSSLLFQPFHVIQNVPKKFIPSSLHAHLQPNIQFQFGQEIQVQTHFITSFPFIFILFFVLWHFVSETCPLYSTI